MQSRRALSVLELLVAMVLLATLLAVSLQLIAALAQQRRALDRRQQALREAANCMERIAARPWDELTPERLTATRLSPEAQQSLPGAALAIDVVPAADPEGKRIVVSVAWQEGDAQPERSVRLVAWRYASP